MDRIDTTARATRWPAPASLVRDRSLIGAMLVAFLLALATNAHARPEQIPKPVEAPEPGESPATGQEAPEDPEDPPMIEPPEGLDCIEDEDDGEDQSSCDPDHPAEKPPGNQPGPAWYDDMSYRMYELQESLQEMSSWASGKAPYIEYYATWMTSVVQQYYSLGYESYGNPREYSYGKMTRGDFNYYYYYWVRVIYFNLLYYSAEYYQSHKGQPYIPEYQDKIGKVAQAYHPLVLCNYGFNGDDEGAREDLAARSAEARAGVP